MAMELAREGWRVESEGQLLRRADAFDVAVHSGIDWFDLEGGVRFGSFTATLPELLAAIRRGERTVTLGDGSLGMVPDEWLARSAAMGLAVRALDGRLRFAKVQVGLLDALLAAMPAITADEMFTQARAELRRFEGIRAAAAPATFRGTLRPYQAEGLGWLDFLRRFGFGGCLADDMGLGKTVQALALLESRRQAGAGPSLVVVPRSLAFNWEREAARFAPELRVLMHAGADRSREGAALPAHDLMITTYGTLRRDAVWLREVEFDYVVLDEAQAIKNAATESAKAARLLRARHRIAMSGTPIENRLADLWSLFEFLNPGMLGAAGTFKQLAKVANGADAETTDTYALIARAVQPFILRRTKQQVARDLPERLEQTLLVDLSSTERTLYDELRDHYRASLLGRIDRDGMAKSKMHVLEALLRLRQAACHPGLVDKKRADTSSSKLEVLVTRLAEVVAEGHKAVVFSQFTSLLAILKKQLDHDAVAYEYLDGRTRDRAARVDRFQSDAQCRLFLVSLKAGGLGLNLTAAEYVFLLDPWWNPAVEAQAIDRAHRIGQTRRVFATRLIARDTVEEKVLALQSGKRALADAIVRADEGPIAKLKREDLEALLA
jgi:SNF2 family DNA or RNA helicase